MRRERGSPWRGVSAEKGEGPVFLKGDMSFLPRRRKHEKFPSPKKDSELLGGRRERFKDHFDT